MTEQTDNVCQPPAPDASPPRGEKPRPSPAPSRIWTVIKIVNVRLRFIMLMVIIGVVAGYWEDIMNHYDRWRRPAGLPEMVGVANVEYYCGMHPNIVKGEPGNCPICGMPLTKRAKTEKTPLPAGVLGRVQLTPLKMNMGRIGTTPIDYRLLGRETRAVGIVEYDETRRATITARVKGRLDKLLVNYTGQKVKQGDALAQIYSPDLLVAQEELLTAARAAAEAKSSGGLAQDLSQSLMESARKKLLLWGLSEQQVGEIIKAGKSQTYITITSPITGIVTERKALEGKYVMEGEELYTVADLSTVWLQAKIFESDLEGIKPGTVVEVTSTAHPREVFAGRITFVSYLVESATRTLAARVEIGNPEEKLRPGMYVTANIRLPMGKVEELPGGQATIQAASQPATSRAAESAPGSAPAGHRVATDTLAQAYLALTATLAEGKVDAAAAQKLAQEADALTAHLPQAAELAAKVKEMSGKDLKAQREAFKGVSQAAIKLLQQAPPDTALFIAHCPMVVADWLTAKPEIHNPYDSNMPTCGNIVGPLKPSAAREDRRFATGYYCPIYPDRLYETPEECKLDKFPMHYARVEKVLAVPESAVIDTGTRKVVYRESAPGVFDMVEVVLGPRAGEFYPVVSGLAPDDKVATAGAFLVDAENRLNPAASAQYFGASGGPSGGGAVPGHKH